MNARQGHWMGLGGGAFELHMYRTNVYRVYFLNVDLQREKSLR